MRLRVLILTIISGIIIGGAVFFIFLKKSEHNKIIPAQMNISPDRAQAFLLPVSEINYLPIRNFSIPEPILGAKAAAIFDVKSGRFLYSKNPDERLPIASVTKLMTAVVILDNLDLSQIYTVPIEDINVDGLGADLYKDEQLRGEDLFKLMLIKSSNDAALTFASAAQKLGIDLVARMNEKAQMLGMADTKFTNPAGLDDNDAFSTASDLVKLVRYVQKYDLISEALITKSADITSSDGKIKHHLANTDQLLGQISGIVIGKTGYTDGALGTMVLRVAINDNKDDIISVVLGSNDRFGETKTLIDWSKKAYYWK